MSKQLKRDVKSLLKGLKALTRKIEKIIEKIEKPEHDQVKPKTDTSRKSVRKPVVKKTSKKPTKNKKAKKTVVGAVMEVIHANTEGVDVTQIMEQTGLNRGQVWPVLSRAKKEGKVKILQKGTIYIGA